MDASWPRAGGRRTTRAPRTCFIRSARASRRLLLDSPSPKANCRSMRVRDLLRMNTGQVTEAPLGITDNPAVPGTWVHRFLSHPVPYKPGTHFLYNSPATYMLSAIVQKTTGQKVLDYLEPRLFRP